MVSVFTFSSLFMVILCVYVTVSGKSNAKEDSVFDGHINKMKTENIFKAGKSTTISPKSRKRRSVQNIRSRREISSLVAGIKAISMKLENLTSGVDQLIESTKGELIGYTDVTKRLEAMNTRLTNRLDQMDQGFVLMFTLLTDVALSTSPRFDKHKKQALEIANDFRKNITTQTAQDMFNKNMDSVFQWYINANFSSCVDIRDSGFTKSGVYPAKIKNTDKLLNIYCDQETDGGGWLVFQRRQDGSEDFYRDWADYKKGFGQLTGEFWLGNDYLHLLTKDDQELRVDLMDFYGNTAYAKYTTFAIGPETESYKLAVGVYSGTAGDSLAYHNDRGFSTKDKDSSGYSKALSWKGAWWYGNNMNSNLNAIYYDKNAGDDVTSFSWFTWKSRWEPLKKSEMKIRPTK